MLNISEKEFQAISTEIKDIKSCITQYIGYIISLSGFAGAIVKYLFDSGKLNYFPLIFIFIALLIITFFFDIIWYKFRSHNRHVGYIQLLAKEIDLQILKKENIKNYLSKKTYLDQIGILEQKIDGITADNLHVDGLSIFSWDFIMSRYRNAEFGDNSLGVINSMKNSFFSFSLPKYYKYSDIDFLLPNKKIDKSNENLDVHSAFFHEIIYEHYGRKSSFKNPLKILYNIFIKDTSYKFLFDNDNVTDQSYQKVSWSYPRTLFRIVLISVAFLLLLSVIIILKSTLPKEIIIFTILYNTLFIFLWFKRYILKYPDLMFGKDSLEGYFWTFMPFRVQFLNSYGIIPKYFSWTFLRYFKSQLILREIDENMSKVKKNKEVKCKACDPPKEPIYEMSSDKTITICSRCLDEYKRIILKNEKLKPSKLRDFHEQIKHTIRINKIDKL